MHAGHAHAGTATSMPCRRARMACACVGARQGRRARSWHAYASHTLHACKAAKVRAAQQTVCGVLRHAYASLACLVHNTGSSPSRAGGSARRALRSLRTRAPSPPCTQTARMPCRRCGTRTAPHRMRMPRCVPGLPFGGVECGMLIVNAALSSANDDGRAHGFPGEQQGRHCASAAGILELSLLSTAPARCSVHAVVHAVGRRHSAWAHCVSCPRCARPARQARRPGSGFVSL